MELRNSLTHHLSKDNLPDLAILQHANNQFASILVIMRACLLWIFSLGINSSKSFYQQKNLALINRVAFFSLLLVLPGTFLLLLMGYEHAFSVLVLAILVCCLILALNATHREATAQAIFAFFPSVMILAFSISDILAGKMEMTLLLILTRQGFCLALTVPMILYGTDRTKRGIVMGICLLLYLLYDVASLQEGNLFLYNIPGVSRGLFSLLSMFLLVGLWACVLYVQEYFLKHDQKIHQSTEKLRSMVIRDGMTGLFNHAFFEQQVIDAMNRSKRSNTPLSLLMMDIDHFKDINDTLGHNAGDQALVQLSRLLEANKRSTDYLGRWGGDELILLLTDTRLGGAALVADKLRQMVAMHAFQGYAHLSLSIGVCEYQAGERPEKFIARADAAMYRAKRAGRNRVEIYTGA